MMIVWLTCLIHQFTMCVLSVGSDVNLVSIDGGVNTNYHLLNDYGLFPRHVKFLKFEVSGWSDAHLTLMSHEIMDSQPFYRIIIGGWGNRKSTLATSYTIIDDYDFNNIIDGHEFRNFWISWEGGNIRVGQGTEVNSPTFLESTGNCPFDIKNIQINTKLGNTISWTFKTPEAIVTSHAQLIHQSVERKFRKMDNCPSFEIISSSSITEKIMCGLYCLRNNQCRGFQFSVESGMCELASDTAVATGIKMVNI